MKILNVHTAFGVGATAIALSTLSPLSMGSAAAAGYTGQTLGDASSAIGDGGQKPVVATRTGDSLSQDDCVVTQSESAPWLKGSDFSPVTDTVLLNVNCNATVATAKTPGNSAASPEGRAALEKQKEEAAKKAQEAKHTASQ